MQVCYSSFSLLYHNRRQKFLKGIEAWFCNGDNWKISKFALQRNQKFSQKWKKGLKNMRPTLSVSLVKDTICFDELKKLYFSSSRFIALSKLFMNCPHNIEESHKQINSKNFHEREKWGLKRPSAAIKTCMDNTAVIMLSKHPRRLTIMQPRSSNKKMEIPQLKNPEKATCDCTSLAIVATWDELACVETLQIHVQYGGHVDIPCSTDGLCPRDPNPSDICHNSNHFLPSENQPTLGGQTT